MNHTKSMSRLLIAGPTVGMFRLRQQRKGTVLATLESLGNAQVVSLSELGRYMFPVDDLIGHALSRTTWEAIHRMRSRALVRTMALFVQAQGSASFSIIAEDLEAAAVIELCNIWDPGNGVAKVTGGTVFVSASPAAVQREITKVFGSAPTKLVIMKKTFDAVQMARELGLHVGVIPEGKDISDAVAIDGKGWYFLPEAVAEVVSADEAHKLLQL